jgi:tetratricopeptide (TPR) repeat protein
MYKGPMKIDDLLADVHHSHGTRAERWERSALLTGRAIPHETVVRTAENVEAAMHFQYGLHQEKQASLQDAVYHFQQALRFKSDFALARRHLGQVYLRQDNSSAAERHFRQALQITPDDPESHYLLAKLYLQQNEPAKARFHFEETIRCQEDHVPALFDLAAMRHTLEGRVPEAMTLYRAVLKIDPDHVSAQNNLAWLLATHPDEKYRDGPEALRLARQVVQQTGGDKPFFLDLLAAAQAECGQFEESVATARQAKALAQAANDVTLAAEIENRLLKYESKEAYRELPVKQN